MNDLKCVSGVELLADYLEGMLPADVSASLEQHVVGCERCRAFLASYQATPAILRAATDVVLPADLRASLGAWIESLASAGEKDV
jgi:anti-sigma factor RsiW